jgi:hypothetical protein
MRNFKRYEFSGTTGLVLVKSPASRCKRIRAMYGQVKTGKTTDELMALLRD